MSNNNEKTMNVRMQQKHDFEANWLKAINFIPKAGEIIIYKAEQIGDPMPEGRVEPITYVRVKYGDGVTNVNDLPFQLGLGQATAEGGEIFCDYENNSAGLNGHAEGEYTSAGWRSHAEGYLTDASASTSHTEGRLTRALGKASHAEGYELNTTINEHNGNIFLIEDTHITKNIIKVSPIITSLQIGDAIYLNDRNTDLNFISTDTKIITNIIHNEAEQYSELTLHSCFLANNYTEETVPNGIIPAGARLCMAIRTTASGNGSHAEGVGTIASGNGSHAEGEGSVSSNWASHAEGFNSDATGAFAHSENERTIAQGRGSHAEGFNTKSQGEYSHAEGKTTIAEGNNSHAEGHNTKAIGTESHAEGGDTIAKGNKSHAEGIKSVAYGAVSHAEGWSDTVADITLSGDEILNNWSATKKFTTALGIGSHAEGYNTLAYGKYAHAEGNTTLALGEQAHSEGKNTRAEGNHSHAEGVNTTALGSASHTEGLDTVVESGNSAAHAEGQGTIAKQIAQHVQGKFNDINDYNYAHIVGGGSNNDNRKNIHTVDWSGNAWFAGNITVGSAKNKIVPSYYFTLYCDGIEGETYNTDFSSAKLLNTVFPTYTKNEIMVSSDAPIEAIAVCSLIYQSEFADICYMTRHQGEGYYYFEGSKYEIQYKKGNWIITKKPVSSNNGTNIQFITWEEND